MTFLYGPLFGLQIAFKDFSVVRGILGSPWVGFDHVVRFLQSYEFWNVLKNTVLLSAYELLALFPLPIVLALMLNTVRWRRYRKAVQLITYAPHFISTVVVVGIIIMLFSTTGGVVNDLIELAGGQRIDFLATGTWRHTYVWSGAWQTLGFSAIIYLAALSSVDPELYEAARVDGAGVLRRIWYIDIPTIMPVMVTLLILNMGSVLSVGFEKVLLMQNPLNLSVSEVIDTYAYRVAFMSSIPQFSYASAVGLFKSVIGLGMLLLANWLARRVAKESLF
ncbi:ABC transporter permease [Pseudactinotalea suaedae]|uniref:ABC transporter permease n=1 Tax=Pseudactinotalea suaedae TaxID=1524924 RepID=UPI001F4FA629|nr:ABC transporter permease subunit [Pseudactinotalea suaedae]